MADIFCCCSWGRARRSVFTLEQVQAALAAVIRCRAARSRPLRRSPRAPRARGAAGGAGAGAHRLASEAVGRPSVSAVRGLPHSFLRSPSQGPCVYLETLRQSIKSKVLMECQHRDSIQVARNDGCVWARSAARGIRRARPAAPAAPVAPTAQPPTPGPAPAPTRRSGSSSWSVSIETLFKLQGVTAVFGRGRVRGRRGEGSAKAKGRRPRPKHNTCRRPGK